ncbi:MAG: hypothetical protein GXP28_05240, partial [Planctomycetes bacterium]|nr:hypothetical protein [Planctomycetota bacterium]
MASSVSQEKEVFLSEEKEVVSEETATRFLGQWNRLVSTTNWEKGSIICGWREALIESGAAVTDYSDEAWAQLVGNVTSQHVGRLRRVNQRFGGDSSQYEGLYWSHLQAALDWDDAEMWLEGAIQNQWSVSQMRGQRWETLETSPEARRNEVAAEESEIDEDLAPEESTDSNAAEKSVAEKNTDAVSPSTASIKSADNEPAEAASETADAEEGSEQAAQVSKRTRLGVDVENLPDDLAEAFESFK